MKSRLAFAFVAVAIVLLTQSGGAFAPRGQQWPAGSTVTMHLALGSSSSPLIDGSPDWDSVAESALAAWNPYLNGVTFHAFRDSSAIASGNRLNTVSFGNDVFGEPFGSGVLAVTQTFYSPRTNTITETDVVFNRARTWNSYRGNTRSASGGTLIDLRRVALHEFGHVIGLDHPDDEGQSVLAVMNSHISNVDGLQADDIERRRRDLRRRRGARATTGHALESRTNGHCRLQSVHDRNRGHGTALCRGQRSRWRRAQLPVDYHGGSVLERRVRQSRVDRAARAGSGRRNHFRIGWPGGSASTFADAAGRVAGQAARGRPPRGRGNR